MLAKKKSFEHKRKAHYNEFMAVKLARQLMQNDDEDADNGEESTVKESLSNETAENELNPEDDAGMMGIHLFQTFNKCS